MTLRIFVTYDSDLDRYTLMCDDGRMSPMPAGPRILHAKEPPAFTYEHCTLEAAEKEAARLRAYLASLAVKKISKKEARKYVA